MTTALGPRESLSTRLRGCVGPSPASVVATALSAAAGEPRDATHSVESLQDRLTSLTAAIPPELPQRARTRALGVRRSGLLVLRRPRRPVLVALVGLVVAALNVPALYLVPVYAGAVGQLPGVSTFLQWSGLGATDVSTIDAGSEHDGVRVHVSAGYADENHTVLVFDCRVLSGAAGAVNGPTPTLTLTDQFGHAYALRQAGFGEKGRAVTTSDVVPGYASFDPLTGAAASVGARLTLHVAGLHAMPASAATGGADIPGSWDVTFTLQRHPAVHLQWAQAALPGATYTFTSVTVTGSTHVEIAWEAKGPAVTAANEKSFAVHRNAQGPAAPDGATAPATSQVDPMVPLRPLLPQLVDAQGNAVTGNVDLAGPVFTAQGDHISGRASYTLRSGLYHFVLGTTDGTGFRRDLVIG
jgi:hypothetical protein